jgi:hypothetical protein
MQNMETQTQSENAVAVRDNPQRAMVPIGNRGVQINDLEGLWRFSGYVSKSQLAPKGFSNQESIFVAVQMGFEVGLTPMAALQNIAVINGRPSLWGDAQLGVVRGSGLMEAYYEEETNEDLHPLFVEMCLEDDVEKRKKLQKEFSRAQSKINRKNDDWGFSVATMRKGEHLRFGRFTVADSKTAGLWAKEGPWRQYPTRMLKFRARSFLLRDVYGDALKGIITAEESMDIPGFENLKRAKPAVAASVMLETSTPMLPAENSPVSVDFTKPESEPVPVSNTEPQSEQAPIGVNPIVARLLEFLTSQGYTPELFFQWAKSAGHIPDSNITADKFPADTAERLFKGKLGVINKMKEFSAEVAS